MQNSRTISNCPIFLFDSFMKKIYFASNFQTNSDSFYFFQQLSTRKFLYFPIFLFHISTNYVRESIQFPRNYRTKEKEQPQWSHCFHCLYCYFLYTTFSFNLILLIIEFKKKKKSQLASIASPKFTYFHAPSNSLTLEKVSKWWKM